MKTVKLLAALAIPAMFAACSNEELVSVENTPQNMAEVVGEELIGTDISMELPNVGVQTRYAGGEWKWDTEDEMGLAWVLYKNAVTPQRLDKAPDADRLYANHLFYVNENTNKFESRGNFYKGWHFGYYPFAYLEAIGEKSYEFDNNMEESILNEDGTTNVAAYSRLYSQKLHLSALQFLTSESVNKDDYSLDSKIDFTLVSPLAQINISASPVAGSQFATINSLKAYGINSITLDVEEDVFASKANIKPTELHKYTTTVPEGKDVKDYNKVELVKSFKKAVVADGALASKLEVSATQIVEGNPKAIYTVGAKSAHVAFVLPATEVKTLDKTKVSIVVEAGGGQFVIKHTGAAETAGSWKADNNAAIEALVAAYAAEVDGKGGELLTNGTLKLNIKLHEDIFEAVWTGIQNIDDWNEKVQLANDLKIKNPTFTLAAGANVVFTADKPIVYPDNENAKGVTVLAADPSSANNGSLTIGYDCTWDENIKYTNGVSIVNNANLTVEGVLTPQRLYNKGTIFAGPLSTVGQKTSTGGNLVNTDGTVVVEYGAYVYTDATQAGTIAYDVPVNHSLTKIETLINGGAAGTANVNTLIVNDTVTLKLVLTEDFDPTSPDNDRYNPSMGTPGGTIVTELDDAALAKVTLDINGGTVSSTKTKTVKNVDMDGGSLNNVNVDGLYLDINGGIVENVSVDADEYVKVNNGTLTTTTIATALFEATAGADVTATTIDVTNDVTINASSIKATTLDATGGVKILGASSIENATVTADVTVNAGATATLKNFNANGTLTNNGTTTVDNTSAANITVLKNNGTFTSNVDVYVKDVTLMPKSTTTLSNNVAESDWNKTIWYTDTYVFDKMTLNGTVTQYAASLLADEIANAEAGATVTLKGDVELAEPLTITKNVTLDLNGKTIKNTSDLWNDDADEWSLISVTGGNVTIKNGNLIAKENDCFPIDVKNGANLTIESGKFVGNISAVYCHEGSVLVKGGEFSIQQLAASSMADDYAGTLNCYDDNYVAGKAKIEVAGGKFLKFDPANNASEGTSTNLLVAGATSTADGDWYVVE